MGEAQPGFTSRGGCVYGGFAISGILNFLA